MNTDALPNKFFQALHGPRGANAWFALGLLGSGGLGVETDRIPRQNVYIGISDGRRIKCLPFFSTGANDWMKDYMVGVVESASGIDLYRPSEIARLYNPATDVFQTPDFQFEVASLVDGIPDPDTATYNEMKFALAPYVAVRFTVNNERGRESLEGFFAVDGVRGIEDLSENTRGEYCGFAEKKGYAIAASAGEGGRTIQQNSMKDLFIDRKPNFKLSRTAGVAFRIPPGETKTLHITVAFFQDGHGTRGAEKTDYAYKDYFPDILAVVDYAHGVRARVWAEARRLDDDSRVKALPASRQFMINHARRSYHASGMLFSGAGHYRYVVNEGSFMMMNTLDLAVDHLMYEIAAMPWAVRNQLDDFIERYSYYDRVKAPGGGEAGSGGISFAHDQGVNGYFTPRQTSSYEQPNLEGCFSFMTAEQLCNFIICAGAYVQKTSDLAWLRRRRSVMEDCLESLLNRDHPAEERRNGIMSFDSDRCGTGSEITTYDSLDPSLGQARGNAFMASKFFASALILERLFLRNGNQALAANARAQAQRCAETICAGFDESLGHLPAILFEGNTTPIIPVAEGLVYLHVCGIAGELAGFPGLLETYRRHLARVLQVGICLFPDKGWKLSAGNSNSWMSKIVSNQFVARQLLKVDVAHCDAESDAAHARWWCEGCRESPCVDQIFEGETNTSGFHYPRGVTCELWVRDYGPPGASA